MKFLYRLLRQNPDSREGVIVTTSVLGILTNLLVAAVKIIVGAAVSSIAIISEGVNNAADVASSLLTLIGAKLSAMHPTRKHPFGFGRVEYLTSMVISILIFLTGFELLKSSVELILHPAELTVNAVSLGVIAVSAAIKWMLGTFTITQGKKISSGSLIAVGTDSRNDCLISAVTFVSALVFLLFHVSVDAYAGIFTSLFVLKAGFDILKDTVGDILGQAGDEELASELYRIIREEPMILNAADMMLHNYGPDAYSGSVNIEVDHSLTIGEIYAGIHALQLKIMHEKNITMVFGMYAVDHDHEEMKAIRSNIAEFVRGQQHVVSYHALYLDPKTNDIYCDLVVDYDLRDWDALRTEFTEYMHTLYPDRHLELVIETNFV